MKRLLFTVAFSLSAFLLIGQHYVDGTMLYHQNPEYPIPGVEATLFDASGAVAGMAITDDNGYFSFDDVPEGTYQLGFETNLAGGNIGLKDALNILYYQLGLINVTPIQFLAMDVTADGKVNMADFNFVLIQYFIFGKPFPAGDWVFEAVEVSTSSREGATTIGGSRTGDSEGALVPTGRDIVNSYQIANAGYKEAAKGDLIELPLKLGDVNLEFMGYGLVLTFDPAMVELVNVVPAGDDAQLLVNGNEVRMSWLNTTLDPNDIMQEVLARFTVRLLSDKLPENGQVFEIQPQSHVLNAAGEKMDYLSFEMPGIKAINQSEYAVYPNPATEFTKLSFELENASMLRLTIFNASGQLANQLVFNGSKGQQTKQISVATLPSGVYQLILEKLENKQILVKQKLLIR